MDVYTVTDNILFLFSTLSTCMVACVPFVLSICLSVGGRCCGARSWIHLSSGPETKGKQPGARL